MQHTTNPFHPPVEKPCPLGWLWRTVGDAITHKLLDSSSNKIFYCTAVHPADDIHPNKHLLNCLGSQTDPTNPNQLH